MDKIIGSVNSHIQIPKSVLEGFSTSKHILNDKGFYEAHKVIFQMDMEGKICEKDIKETNTQFGYFEDIIEKEVLSTIETSFGNIKAKAIKVIKNIEQGKCLDILITEKELSAVKKYCSLCYVRSENFVQQVQRKSIMKDFIANEPQNTVIYVYLQYPEIVDSLFNNLDLFVIKNASPINLLLPQCGMIMRQNSTTKEISVFIPISAKICLMLSSGQNLKFVSLMDKDFVGKLNKFLIESEFNNNHKAIYAKNKSDLEHYKDYLLSLHYID